MRNIPPGFGSRPGDHEYFDYPDPRGCEACEITFSPNHATCPECGSREHVIQL